MQNALATETSPYLRQHAGNPVNWLPWGSLALERARREDKPLLVSIGYSACHWCHVMERESFEDPRTAAVMNEEFVCVKVDREERPDVDALYMEAVQSMTGHGGWPLNVFLTPEQLPFYGGTYYPPDPRPGIPAWTQVLQAIAEAWSEHREEIRAGGEQLRERLSGGALLEPSCEPLRENALDEAVTNLRAMFDSRNCCVASTRWRSTRCTLWPKAASMTSSAAGSTATPSMPPGRCPTSRRCSTTMPYLPARIYMAGS
jgi:uncharacterized protein